MIHSAPHEAPNEAPHDVYFFSEPPITFSLNEGYCLLFYVPLNSAKSDSRPGLAGRLATLEKKTLTSEVE